MGVDACVANEVRISLVRCNCSAFRRLSRWGPCLAGRVSKGGNTTCAAQALIINRTPAHKSDMEAAHISCEPAASTFSFKDDPVSELFPLFPGKDT